MAAMAKSNASCSPLANGAEIRWGKKLRPVRYTTLAWGSRAKTPLGPSRRPYQGNGALLATVDAIAGGRLQVGIALGGRPEDYEATGMPFHERGRAFDAQLAEMQAVWAQQPRGHAGAIGPAPVQAGGPPLLLGGTAPAAFRRMTEFGTGWIMGGGGPQAFAAGADKARQAWRDAGRAGAPAWPKSPTSASATTLPSRLTAR